MVEINETSAAPGAGGASNERLLGCPFAQLEAWLQQAMEKEIPDPAVMVLATVGADGRPDQRAVLLKHNDVNGLVFFADFASKKASDIAASPYVNAHFLWHELNRQVRINGRAEKMGAADTTRYFITNPEHEQEDLADWGLRAEKMEGSRAFLMQQFEAMKSKFYDGGRQPSHWGGFRIIPERFEFWQGGGPRRRERSEYRLADSGEWVIERLGGL